MKSLPLLFVVVVVAFKPMAGDPLLCIVQWPKALFAKEACSRSPAVPPASKQGQHSQYGCVAVECLLNQQQWNHTGERQTLALEKWSASFLHGFSGARTSLYVTCRACGSVAQR